MASDSDALDQLAEVSDISKVHAVQHYLYFPSKIAARRAASDIVKQKYVVTERLGADLKNWLVLAEHRIVPTLEALTAARAALEKCATKFGGEYDGWEAAVRSINADATVDTESNNPLG
ncbi:MAG: ribonuclease E inhibitor RraB [Pirellulales bacterium]